MERSSFVCLKVLPPHLQSQRVDILSLFFFHVAIHSRSYGYVHQVETIARYSLLRLNGEVLIFQWVF